jgi:hypothetical protein
MSPRLCTANVIVFTERSQPHVLTLSFFDLRIAILGANQITVGGGSGTTPARQEQSECDDDFNFQLNSISNTFFSVQFLHRALQFLNRALVLYRGCRVQICFVSL